MIKDYLEILRSVPLDFGNPDVDIEKNEIVLSIGKAALFMYERYCEKFPVFKKKKGLIILPEGLSVGNVVDSVQVLYSTHPDISQTSFNVCCEIFNFIETNKPGKVTVLLSGGSSSLVEHSKHPQKTIANNEHLLNSGLDIVSLNKKRIANSLIKGGKFAERYPHIFFKVFVMSDIPFDEGENYVGSMPFYRKDLENTSLKKCADSNTFHDHLLCCLQPLKTGKIDSVRKFSGTVNELFELVLYHIKNREDHLLVTGEPTVRISLPEKGSGGRMSHLALMLLPFLDRSVSLLALSSDGKDGNSSYAGAVIDCVPEKIQKDEINKALLNYDSATYLSRHGFSVESGYTGINLNDFIVVVRK